MKLYNKGDIKRVKEGIINGKKGYPFCECNKCHKEFASVEGAEICPDCGGDFSKLLHEYIKHNKEKIF